MARDVKEKETSEYGEGAWRNGIKKVEIRGKGEKSESGDFKFFLILVKFCNFAKLDNDMKKMYI